jgi:orotate phosphoribosyltransferase
MPNIRALKAMAKLKINIGPIKKSTGEILPFYNDSRDTYSHLDVLRVFVEELAKIVRGYQRRGKRIDLIVGVPMAGIPAAMALALKTNIPFAYLNKERKKALQQRMVEGDYKKGAQVLIIDDTIGSGATIDKAIKDCRSDGLIVKHVMTLWNPWHLINKDYIVNLRKRGITYDTLNTRVDWIDYLYAHHKVSKEMVDLQKAYLANPSGWHKDRAMWQKFLNWKKRYNKTKKL